MLFNDVDADLAWSTGDTVTGMFHHNVNDINEIESAYVDGAATSITDDGEFVYIYDPWNRIISIEDASTSIPAASYRYDALGRRIHKPVSNSGDLNTSANGDYLY